MPETLPNPLAAYLTAAKRDLDRLRDLAETLVPESSPVKTAENPAPVEDERIAAWHKVADHPAFRPCFLGDGPLLPRMLAKLDEWASLTQTAPTVNPEDLRHGDRFRVIYEYRVDQRGDWQPVAENRYELLSHDDDPRVAVVEEWVTETLKGDREDAIRDLLARLDAMRADQ